VSRPSTLVVLTGTGTEVGKTFVAVELLRTWRARGLDVAARKPAQSFDADEVAAGAPTDHVLLAEASGEALDVVCPPHRSYPRAMAPPMAADSLGLPLLTAAELIDELGWAPGTDVGLVETAGGAASPITHDATSAELAHQLRPDVVVLVADAGLGTIHAVTTTLLALTRLPTVVHLNRFDDGNELHRRNLAWLEGAGLRPTVSVGDLTTRLVG
jgi:dethiobiotin synthetase